jgi:hypothetical protein
MDDKDMHAYKPAVPHRAETSDPPGCPIRLEADFTLLTFKCSRCVLRQFRESLIKCHACPEFEQCDIHELRQAQVDRSLSALNEEWGW